MIDTNIIPFADSRKEDVDQVGGKAANLGELTSIDMPVPPGFTVPAMVYFRFVRGTGLQDKINQAMSRLNVDNSSALKDVSNEIKRLFMQTEVPSDVVEAVRLAYDQLVGSEVAVRSSATAEDLPDASFAGQQATFLNVHGPDAVVKAVQACWASLYEARAIFYRVQQGYDHESVGLATVVQTMVQSAKAGVMFTRNATDGNPDHVQIDAAYGLGEAVVSGEVTPDSYIVSKTKGEIIRRKVATQTKMLVRNPDYVGGSDGANIWRSVPDFLVDAPKLTDDQIVELSEMARRVEAHYGVAQDMEWAIDDDGKLWLTQARPLTVDLRDYMLDLPLDEEEPAELILTGRSTGPGVAEGNVVILSGPDECDLVLKGDILVADMTTPDYVTAMKRASAIVTEDGGATCHAAIVARELGLPCIVGAKGALEILGALDGKTVTVDASHGEVFRGVAMTRLTWNERRLEATRVLEAEMANIKTNTKVMVILADPDEAPRVADMNVDGVGLLRLEFILNRIGVHPQLFIDEGRPEGYIDQIVDGVSALAGPFGDRPVILRLMDFKTNELAKLRGGDFYEKAEENPMLGFRGAFRYQKRVDTFALELEAIRKVREVHKNLHIMVPFVRTPEELKWTLEFMAMHGLERGVDGLKVWMMAEVPSNFLLLDEFIDVGIDGMSVGSNDLTQLVLGRDRDNALLGELDERDPAVMKAIETIVRGCRARGITVGICGQAPSNYPEVTRKLVEWGATSISVSSDTLVSTRKIVHDVEAELT